MGRCDGRTCDCIIEPGAGAAVDGSGTLTDPYVISLDTPPEDGVGFPPGSMMMYVGFAAPTGWLLCEGQAVSRTTYAGLYAVIGTTFGVGDGTDTFNVPDLRERFPLGHSETRPLGTSGGTEDTTLAVGNIPGHTHTMAHVHSIAHNHGAFDSGDAGEHDHPITSTNLAKDDAATNAATVSRGQSGGSNTNAPIGDAGAHHHTVNVPNYTGNSGGSSAAATGSTGSGAAFSNMPPYTALTFIIRT